MTVTQPAMQQPRVRPRALWYLAVVLLWIASMVLLVVAVAPFIRVLEDGVTPISIGQQVPVSGSGITVYSRTEPTSRDCLMRDSTGQTFSMDHFAFDLSTTIDGRTVYAVATSPRDLPAGDYQIACPGVGSQLYYGGRLPLVSMLVRAGISFVLGLLGLILLIVLMVRRHTSKSRIRSQQLLGPPSGTSGWTPQPYRPPPGYGAPGPPPYQGQPYQGQPYQSQPYQSQPYPNQPDQSQPYPTQPGQPPVYPGQHPEQPTDAPSWPAQQSPADDDNEPR